MFNVNKFLTKPQKFILEQNFKNYLSDSVNKYNKLTNEINEKNKTKQAMKNIFNETRLIRSTNHIQNKLINNARVFNFFFYSFICINRSLNML